MKIPIDRLLADELEFRFGQGYKFNDFMQAYYTNGFVPKEAVLNQISGKKLARILLNGYVVLEELYENSQV